ncbi:MAG: type I-B CRISPR-associated protein Cas8b1/Cst1, partial [Chloroflexota bacterium]
MIEYSGHPLVDVGIATIAAFVNKRDLSSITEADLDKVADFMAKQYVKDPLVSFLTVAFPNSGFTNPAFSKTPKKRDEYAERVLYGFKSGIPQLNERCVFTGEP